MGFYMVFRFVLSLCVRFFVILLLFCGMGGYRMVCGLSSNELCLGFGWKVVGIMWVFILLMDVDVIKYLGK